MEVETETKENSDTKKLEDVIILAKGESRALCPFDADEVWGVNDVGEFPEFRDKKIDKLFTFDPRSPEFLANCRKHAPIVSWRDYADIKYPLEEIKAHYNTEYFSNTIGYMMAYAGYIGVKRIRLFGVDAPFGSIYFLEKPGIEYWAGKLEENGVEVITSKGSHIKRTKDGLIYGDRTKEGWVMLYLSERLSLLNLLPKEGTHDEMYISDMARWVFAVKEDEGKEHGVTINKNVNGTFTYLANEEFTKEIWLPEWGWRYVTEILADLEKQKKLPIGALSVYEKLVKFGNADSDTDYIPELTEEDKERDVKLAVFKAKLYDEALNGENPEWTRLFAETKEQFDKANPPKQLNKPVRVSYILGTKNRAKFLENTFQNLQKLITPNDELIVVDGKSTDDTMKVIAKYRSMITTLISEPDISSSHAMNRGILVARGKYVKQIEDDDVIFSQGMEQAIVYMEANPLIDLLVCGGTKQFQNRTVLIQAPVNYGTTPQGIFMYGACGTGFLYRRDCFAKYGMIDVYTKVPDQEYALRVRDKGIVRFLPVNLYLHRILPHSTSIQDPQGWKDDQFRLMKKYLPKRQYYMTKYLRKIKIRGIPVWG